MQLSFREEDEKGERFRKRWRIDVFRRRVERKWWKVVKEEGMAYSTRRRGHGGLAQPTAG